MGNFYSDNTSTNITQSQIQSINSKCNQSASSNINDVNITAIDSHLGDITLSATLVVGDLTCVMNDLLSSTATAIASNTSNSQITSLPFQGNLNSVSVANITDIQSYQQSIINQSCVQSTIANVSDVNFTFIDSSTGNIKISSSSQIQTFSCNLTAASYQSAAATAVNDSTSKITSGCCAFDLSMLLPILLGIVAAIVISKYASKKGGPGAAVGGEAPSQDEINTQLLTQTLAALPDSSSGRTPQVIA